MASQSLKSQLFLRAEEAIREGTTTYALAVREVADQILFAFRAAAYDGKFSASYSTHAMLVPDGQPMRFAESVKIRLEQLCDLPITTSVLDSSTNATTAVVTFSSSWAE